MLSFFVSNIQLSPIVSLHFGRALYQIKKGDGSPLGIKTFSFVSNLFSLQLSPGCTDSGASAGSSSSTAMLQILQRSLCMVLGLSWEVGSRGSAGGAVRVLCTGCTPGTQRGGVAQSRNPQLAGGVGLGAFALTTSVCSSMSLTHADIDFCQRHSTHTQV